MISEYLIKYQFYRLKNVSLDRTYVGAKLYFYTKSLILMVSLNCQSQN